MVGSSLEGRKSLQFYAFVLAIVGQANSRHAELRQVAVIRTLHAYSLMVSERSKTRFLLLVRWRSFDISKSSTKYV